MAKKRLKDGTARDTVRCSVEAVQLNFPFLFASPRKRERDEYNKSLDPTKRAHTYLRETTTAMAILSLRPLRDEHNAQPGKSERKDKKEERDLRSESSRDIAIAHTCILVCLMNGLLRFKSEDTRKGNTIKRPCESALPR
jgi:hypothetical protein